MPAGADRVTMARKTAGIRFPGHSYESCKPPRQLESENEMIVISHHLFGWPDMRDDSAIKRGKENKSKKLLTI